MKDRLNILNLRKILALVLILQLTISPFASSLMENNCKTGDNLEVKTSCHMEKKSTTEKSCSCCEIENPLVAEHENCSCGCALNQERSDNKEKTEAVIEVKIIKNLTIAVIAELIPLKEKSFSVRNKTVVKISNNIPIFIENSTFLI